MANPEAGVLPIYKFETVTHRSLRKATSAKPDFTYFLVCNNGFLDWGLKKNFLLNWKESKPKLFDGSKNVFSATRLDWVEQAVFGVMSHSEETRDRFVYVKDIHISQNQFLGMTKKVEAGEMGGAYFLSTQRNLRNIVMGAWLSVCLVSILGRPICTEIAQQETQA